MIIVLPKNFFTLDDGSLLFDHCLNNLLQMHDRNFHFLFLESPKEGFRYLKNSRLDGWNKEIFKNICTQSRHTFSILDSIPYYVKISSFCGRTIQNYFCCNKSINKSLEFYEDYKNSDKTILLSENMIDCTIYEYYFNVYSSYINNFKEFTLSFEKMHGGGATSDKIFDYYSNSKNIIYIKDSDCSTSDGVHSSLFNVNDVPFNAKYYINCHEIENTIPCSVLHEIIPNISLCEKFYKVIKYSSDKKLKFHHFFDYKKGITVKWFTSLPCHYAQKLIALFNEAEIDVNLENLSDDSQVLIYGFGDKLLELYEQFLLRNSIIKMKEIYKENFFQDFFPGLLEHIIAMAIAPKRYHCNMV